MYSLAASNSIWLMKWIHPVHRPPSDHSDDRSIMQECRSAVVANLASYTGWWVSCVELLISYSHKWMRLFVRSMTFSPANVYCICNMVAQLLLAFYEIFPIIREAQNSLGSTPRNVSHQRVCLCKSEGKFAWFRLYNQSLVMPSATGTWTGLWHTGPQGVYL